MSLGWNGGRGMTSCRPRTGRHHRQPRWRQPPDGRLFASLLPRLLASILDEDRDPLEAITALTDDGILELKEMLPSARATEQTWNEFLEDFVSDSEVVERFRGSSRRRQPAGYIEKNVIVRAAKAFGEGLFYVVRERTICARATGFSASLKIWRSSVPTAPPTLPILRQWRMLSWSESTRCAQPERPATKRNREPIK